LAAPRQRILHLRHLTFSIMILVDNALARRASENRPLRAGIVGSGTIGSALVRQIMRHVPGMTVGALYNRHVEKARDAFRSAGASHAVEVHSAGHLEDNLRKNIPSFTDNPDLLSLADGIDVI